MRTAVAGVAVVHISFLVIHSFPFVALAAIDPQLAPSTTDYGTSYLGVLISYYRRNSSHVEQQAVEPDKDRRESWRKRQWKRIMTLKPWVKTQSSKQWQKVRSVFARIRNRHTKNDHSATASSKQQMVANTLAVLQKLNPNIGQEAKHVGMPLTEGTISRYLAAGSWTNQFFGKPVPDAILQTIRWRKSMNINKLNKKELWKEAQSGKGYVHGHDSTGRSIVYYRLGRENTTNPEDHHKLLVYTMDRARKLSKPKANEQFVVILDFKNFEMQRAPPVKQLRAAFDSLQLHFPACLGTLYVVGVSTAAKLLWTALSPMISQKTKQKILFLSEREAKHVLPKAIGVSNLEVDYGGNVRYHWDPATYFAR